MNYIYSSEFEDQSILQIFNSRCQQIRNYSLNPERRFLDIDLSDQENGIYIYRMITNEKVYSGNKIILQK